MNQQVELAGGPGSHAHREKLRALVGRLETEAKDRVGKRRPIEDRWLLDLEQYHGEYDRETQKNLNEGDKSKLFINLTQPKTDAMAAKLMDLLFPTDDKNWGIKPTPNPQLMREASRAVLAAQQLREQAEEVAKAQQAEQAQADPQKLAEAQELEEKAKVAEQANKERQDIIDEAKTRSDRMAETMDDQLKQALYAANMRDLIDDGCRLGTGVCKGPITGQRVRKGWKKFDRFDEATGQPVSGFELSMSQGNQPSYKHVDIWSFFPDMDARTVEESEGFFERHLKNKQQLRKLAKLPGFDKNAIRKLIERDASEAAPTYLTSLRQITGSNEIISKNLFHVWEFTGPIAGEEMQLLAEAFDDKDAMAEVEEIDPLQELQAVVWFCDGEVLKFSIYPMDSGETIYSVFNLMKDEASIFGKGIPAIMRDPQKSLNAAWRAMMDNGGLSSGPQVVIATQYIEPVDGDYTLAPRKVWRTKTAIPQNAKAFDAYNIPNNQVELANIIELSKRFIDDMTSMPQIQQGEPGTGVAQTVGGAVLVMNSANVVFRRVVKNFDDDVTVPNIRRLYDWNMQFNQDPNIKGDYEVDARGSSVLLVKELQAQNLFLIALHLGSHPTYGPMLRSRNVLKLLFQAHMIPADEVLLSEDDIKETVDAATLQAQAQQMQAETEQRKYELEVSKIEQQANSDNAKVQRDLHTSNVKFQQTMLVEASKQETAMMLLAGKMNMNQDTIEAKLAEARERRMSEEKKLAAELAATEVYGPTGGGVL